MMKATKLFFLAFYISALPFEVNCIPKFLETLHQNQRILAQNWKNLLSGKDQFKDQRTVLNDEDPEFSKDLLKMGHDFLFEMFDDYDHRAENSLESDDDVENLIKTAAEKIDQKKAKDYGNIWMK